MNIFWAKLEYTFLKDQKSGIYNIIFAYNIQTIIFDSIEKKFIL